MQMNVRITWTRFLVACVLPVVVGIVFLGWFIRRGPSAVITDRTSLQALLFIPKDLRGFVVEEYVKSGDSFAYQMPGNARIRPVWRLQISAAVKDIEYWKDAFRSYLGQCGRYLERQSSPGETRMPFTPSTSPGARGQVSFKADESTGELRITFVYYQPSRALGIWKVKWNRILASVLRRARPPVAIHAITSAT